MTGNNLILHKALVAVKHKMIQHAVMCYISEWPQCLQSNPEKTTLPIAPVTQGTPGMSSVWLWVIGSVAVTVLLIVIVGKYTVCMCSSQTQCLFKSMILIPNIVIVVLLTLCLFRLGKSSWCCSVLFLLRSLFHNGQITCLLMFQLTRLSYGLSSCLLGSK